MSRRIVPVSTLIRYIKQHMEQDPVLHGVMIEGEISNFRRPSSGHWYFSLKDEYSSIPVVMFAAANRRLSFRPNQGDKVVLIGDVTVYEAEGRMQMIASGMQPTGIGDLYLKLEALKKKLSAEGLFDPAHKKSIPAYAMNIALVTGNNTAAREDVLTTLRRRWPIAEIHEYPCPVQGMEAAPKIIESLMKADHGNHQIILLVRGGGSLEDLWCFNDEALARCIYALNTPVICGVGHEIDFTIADYVSDLRANTPTGAAEAAVPDRNEIHVQLMHLQSRMVSAMRSRDEACRTRLMRSSGSMVFTHPERLYQQQMRLDNLETKLMRAGEYPAQQRQYLNVLRQKFVFSMHRSMSSVSEQTARLQNRLVMAAKDAVSREEVKLFQYSDDLKEAVLQTADKRRTELEQNMRLLDAYSPLKIMDRGYSVVYKNDHVITSCRDAEKGDEIRIRMSDGSFTAEVKDRKD